MEISIRDHGRGIAATDLLKIFDPFYSTKTGGTGLGLATSYSIIKKHGGLLTVCGGMGGQEMIHKLIKMDPGAKAIVSSGYSNSMILSDYKEYGFKAALPKPYTSEELMEGIGKAMGLNAAGKKTRFLKLFFFQTTKMLRRN